MFDRYASYPALDAREVEKSEPTGEGIKLELCAAVVYIGSLGADPARHTEKSRQAATLVNAFECREG